jgi:hypothetical protein
MIACTQRATVNSQIEDSFFQLKCQFFLDGAIAMKRLLFLLLLTVCSVSWADWEFVGGATDSTFSRHIDKSTLRKNGSLVKLWVMDNFAQTQTDPAGRKFKSQAQLLTYDCVSETVAAVSFTDFSGYLGSGSIVSSNTWKELEWNPIYPGSIGEIVWKIACEKK